MNTDIDYKVEKTGWVLVEESTGQLFKDANGAWFEVTSEVSQAAMFKTLKDAVRCAKSTVMCGRPWLVIPGKVSILVEATRAKRVQARRRT